MDTLKLKLALWAIRFLALLSLGQAQKLGAFLGRLVYHGNFSPTRVTRTNLEHCFPEMAAGEREKLVAASVIETGKMSAEIGLSWLWPIDRVRALIVKRVGLEHIEQAFARGKGVIYIGPHLGNWEIAGIDCTFHGCQGVMYQPPKLKGFEDFMRETRGRMDAELLPTNNRGVIRVLKLLKQNGSVGILPDQEPPYDSGLFVPFFGISANTMTLISKLVQKTGASVVWAVAKRLPDGEGFEMHYGPADEMLYAEDLATSVEGLSRTVEQCVLRMPEQYQWEYKRFKRRPERAPHFY